MKNHLLNLEQGLKKIKAVEEAFSVFAQLQMEGPMAALTSARDAAIAEWNNGFGKKLSDEAARHNLQFPVAVQQEYDRMHRALVSGNPNAAGTVDQHIAKINDAAKKWLEDNLTYLTDGIEHIWVGPYRGTTAFSVLLEQYKKKMATYRDAVWNYVKSITPSMEESEVPAEEAPAEEVPSKETERASAPAAPSAPGWEGYTSRGGPREMEAAWGEYVLANPDEGYDNSFNSWLSWYNSVRGDRHLSPDEVLGLLRPEEAAPEAAPTEEGVTGPVAKPAEEEVAPAEEPPIAEEPMAVEDALSEYFRQILTKVTRVDGPLRMKNARAKGRIRRLGGHDAAARAVLEYAGGGDFEAGKELYSRYSQREGERVTEQRGGRAVSMGQMSELQNRALADLLALNVRDFRPERERRASSEERYEELLKIAEDAS